MNGVKRKRFDWEDVMGEELHLSDETVERVAALVSERIAVTMSKLECPNCGQLVKSKETRVSTEKPEASFGKPVKG